MIVKKYKTFADAVHFYRIRYGSRVKSASNDQAVKLVRQHIKEGKLVIDKDGIERDKI